jgi:hypothetical protein
LFRLFRRKEEDTYLREITMPPELRKAHQLNDKAVMQAYGFDLKMSESEIVEELMRLYQGIVWK